MKVNAITNTNFKGLFTDRTKENNGDWRMEYRPYSWETKKANKAQNDIYSSKLPTNEEIYTKEPGLEISEDILGTKSYIKDTRNGRDVLRIQIEDMPSMNYEDSLKVLDKKLEAFWEMKQDAMKDLKKPLENRDTYLFNLSHQHGEYVSDVRRTLGSHIYEKNERARGLEQEFDKVTKYAEDLGDSFENYTKLAESANDVRNQREHIREELNKIMEAKLKNNLIDVSRRDTEAPYTPLYKALQNIEKAKGKLVALSDRTITVENLLKAVGEDCKIYKVIDYIEKLMMKKI